MTQDELQEQIESAVVGYSSIEGVSDELWATFPSQAGGDRRDLPIRRPRNSSMN